MLAENLSVHNSECDAIVGSVRLHQCIYLSKGLLRTAALHYISNMTPMYDKLSYFLGIVVRCGGWVGWGTGRSGGRLVFKIEL